MTMKRNNLLPAFIFLIVLLAFTISADAQCAMCRKIAESDMSKGHPATVSKNINMGILYLLAVPYVALAVYFRKQIVGVYKSFRASNKSTSHNV
jgi:hypothetical protein